METAIQVVWWIGLAGALTATAVILKEVALIVRELRAIHKLAEITREAARGLADGVAAAPRLRGLDDPARSLSQAADALRAAAESVEQRLDALAGGSAPREG